MTHRIAHNISLFLCKKGEIDTDELDIYEYGFEVLLDAVLETIMLITLGVVFNEVLNTLIFIAAFALLRNYTGGYHASSKVRCVVITTTMYISNVMIAQLRWHILWYVIAAVIGIIVIWRYAPVEHINKQLEEHIREKNKGISRVLAICIFFVILFLNSILPVVSNILAIALFQVAILMIMGRKIS